MDLEQVDRCNTSTPTKALPRKLDELDIEDKKLMDIDVLSQPRQSTVSVDVNLGKRPQLFSGTTVIPFYNIFMNMSLDRLKNVCRVWKSKRTGPKDALTARCTLFVFHEAESTSHQFFSRYACLFTV